MYERMQAEKVKRTIFSFKAATEIQPVGPISQIDNAGSPYLGDYMHQSQIMSGHPRDESEVYEAANREKREPDYIKNEEELEDAMREALGEESKYFERDTSIYKAEEEEGKIKNFIGQKTLTKAQGKAFYVEPTIEYDEVHRNGLVVHRKYKSDHIKQRWMKHVNYDSPKIYSKPRRDDDVREHDWDAEFRKADGEDKDTIQTYKNWANTLTKQEVARTDKVIKDAEQSFNDEAWYDAASEALKSVVEEPFTLTCKQAA